MTRTLNLGTYTVTIETDTVYASDDNQYWELRDANGNDCGHGWLSGGDETAPDNEILAHVADYAFSRYGHGGYPALFVGDGFCTCVKCGIESLISDEDCTLEYTVDWSQGDNPSGMSCDACYEWIYEPFCAECGKVESECERALESNISGDRMLCRDCIATALVRAREYDSTNEYQMRANLIGVHAYQITNNWYAGTYGSGAYAATR